jgi:uncharacterized protein (TIGR00299 family) protein
MKPAAQKTLHFDCFAGISGDMTLGALVNLGVDPALLNTELEKLKLDGWKLDFIPDERKGITGTRALVKLGAEGEPEHHHVHDNHDHHEHHEQRTYKAIREIIQTSSIREGAKRRALDIFSHIAKAESEVHGVPLDEIAFHEVGALDSIVDIVGTAICLDILGPGRITAGRVELGSGTVHCAHGELPVPAPATLILCRGMPVHVGGFDREMTTPTGAGILASQVDEFISEESFTELKSGYGIGSRKLDKPNVLRVSWRETADREQAGAQTAQAASDLHPGDCVLMETNIDDMTGEEMGFLMECLFNEGARDVIFIPCVMKKSRPGTLVSVLCPAEKLEALRKTMFINSKTIGVREIPARCFALKREEETISGEYRKKTVYYGGEKLRDKIEFEDKADLARKNGIPLWDAETLLRKADDGK